MSRYRKKPVEAIQYHPHDNCAEVKAFVGYTGPTECADNGPDVAWAIETPEGTMYASPGDWIIRGVQGEFYPVKPEIFEATYEPCDD